MWRQTKISSSDWRSCGGFSGENGFRCSKGMVSTTNLVLSSLAKISQTQRKLAGKLVKSSRNRKYPIQSVVETNFVDINDPDDFFYGRKHKINIHTSNNLASDFNWASSQSRLEINRLPPARSRPTDRQAGFRNNFLQGLLCNLWNIFWSCTHFDTL